MAVNLILVEDVLQLQVSGQRPMAANFSVSTWQHRRDAGRSQILIKAIKPKPGMTIIDATAGWGRDAAILASFGAKVIMLERNAVMIQLLQNALNRQTAHDKKILNLELIHVDAIQYFQILDKTNYPDLIYIDPMHPERKHGIKVKKDLQILQNLIGVDYDADQLLKLARRIAPVIVKWPLKTSALADDVVYSWCAKTIRMDKYATEAVRNQTIVI
jgi:16S rRNA (guanine1516-N2)-methyltransferase